MSNKVTVEPIVIRMRQQGLVPAFVVAVASETFMNLDDENVVGGDYTCDNLEWFQKVPVIEDAVSGVYISEAFEGDNAISATVWNGEDIGVTWTFLLTNAEYKIIEVLATEVKIFDDVETTTLKEAVRRSRSRRFIRAFNSYVTHTELYEMLAGLYGAVVKATTTIFGVVRIDTPMANPVAVTTNSALLTLATPIKLGRVFLSKVGAGIALAAEEVFYTVLRRTRFVEDYAGADFAAKYAALVADVGTEQRYKFIISDTQILSTDLTTAANIKLEFQYPGKLEITDADLVMNGGMVDPGYAQVFVLNGTASATFGENTMRDFWLEWWSGIPTAGNPVDATFGLRDARTSIERSHGGVLNVGVGDFESSLRFNPLNGMLIEGKGSNPYGNFVGLDPNGGNGGGTNIIYTGSEDEFFYAGHLSGGANNQRQMVVRNLNIDCRNTPANCFSVQGAGQNIYGIKFEDVVFLGGEKFCVDINVTNAAQTEQVMFDHCYFIGAALGQVRINTNNGTNVFHQCYFATPPNKSCLILNKIGTTTLNDCHLVGANTVTNLNTVVATAATDIVGIAFNGAGASGEAYGGAEGSPFVIGTYYDTFPTGQKGTFSANGTATLPPQLVEDLDYYLIRLKDADPNNAALNGQYKVAATREDALAGIPINLTVNGSAPSALGWINFNPTVVEGRAGVEFSFIDGGTEDVQGVDLTNFVMFGCQDEALNYSILSEAYQYHGNTTLIGNLFQGNGLLRGRHTIISQGNTGWAHMWRDNDYNVTETDDPLWTAHPYLVDGEGNHFLANSRVISTGDTYGGNRGISMELVIDPVTRRSSLVPAADYNLPHRFEGYSEVTDVHSTLTDVRTFRDTIRIWINNATKWRPFENFSENHPLLTLATNQPDRFLLEIGTSTINWLTRIESITASWKIRRNANLGFLDVESSQTTEAYMALRVRGSVIAADYIEYVAGDSYIINRVAFLSDGSQVAHDDAGKTFVNIFPDDAVVTIPSPERPAFFTYDASLDVAANAISIPDSELETGRAVKAGHDAIDPMTDVPIGTLPTPLVNGNIYYIISDGGDEVMLAATYANAIAGTPIPLTLTPGTGLMRLTPLLASLPVQKGATWYFVRSNTGALTIQLSARAILDGAMLRWYGGSGTSYAVPDQYVRTKVLQLNTGDFLVTNDRESWASDFDGDGDFDPSDLEAAIASLQTQVTAAQTAADNAHGAALGVQANLNATNVTVSNIQGSLGDYALQTALDTVADAAADANTAAVNAHAAALGVQGNLDSANVTISNIQTALGGYATTGSVTTVSNAAAAAQTTANNASAAAAAAQATADGAAATASAAAAAANTAQAGVNASNLIITDLQGYAGDHETRLDAIEAGAKVLDCGIVTNVAGLGVVTVNSTFASNDTDIAILITPADGNTGGFAVISGDIVIGTSFDVGIHSGCDMFYWAIVKRP